VYGKRNAAWFVAVAGLLMGPSSAMAAPETFLDGVYATGEGCAALAEQPLDEIPNMNFIMLTDEYLIGQEFGCAFRKAEDAPDVDGWRVSAECESGGAPTEAEIEIAREDENRVSAILHINGQTNPLGAFDRCPKIAEQP
jgi:uroporphyrinogen-III decarboxylase